MAIGAYTIGAHAVRAGIPFELALIAGGLRQRGIGIVFGVAALRVKGLYLAMTTLAMQYVVDFVISHVPAISGGTPGDASRPRRCALLGISIECDGSEPLLLRARVCVFVTLFMLNLRRTSFGRALVAVREKDYRRGDHRRRHLQVQAGRLLDLVLHRRRGGAVLVFCYLRSVTPEQFHLELSIQVVAMVIVGGLGSVLGSFFGAALILLTPIILNNLVGCARRGSRPGS